MAIQRMAGRRALAQSTDAKPDNYPIGYKITELDTGRQYMFDGAQWIFIKRLWDSEQKAKHEPRTSLVQLFGDTFAKTAASAVFLLEDLTDEQGGTSLTNNGSIALTRIETEGFLRGYLVPRLNGTTQYFSMPTEAKVEVGTGSFIIKADIKTDRGTGTTQYAVSYGDIGASEQYWAMAVLSGTNEISFSIDDGTTELTVSDDIPNRIHDGKLHRVIAFVDRTKDLMHLFVDGEEVTDPTDISSVTGTLNNAGENFLIGCRNNGAAFQSFWQGEVSNVQIYKDADYNLPSILAAGIRESANTGGLSQIAQSSGRLNNLYFMANATTSQMSTVIHTDEGYYDIIELFEKNANHGIGDLSIDGVVVSTTDRYSASQTFDNKQTTRGVFIGAGTHILKLAVNGKNGSSSGHFISTQLIELIKRDGSNEGGCTSFNLFGDEIKERTDDDGWAFATDTGAVYNQDYTNSTPADNQFSEGTLFFKKGLWKITFTYVTFSTYGQIDLDFGNVEVLDQLDGYTAGLVKNNQVTKFVRLNGGKTNVRLAVNGKNGSSTDFIINMASIRGELVSGSGMGDRVEISYVDDDKETVKGTSGNPVVGTAFRKNGYRGSGSATDDEFLHRRWFSGGTYRAKLVYWTNSDRGIVNIGTDASGATNIFSSIDTYSVGSVGNVESFNIVEITRGYHDIHFTTNGKNGSSSNFFINWQFLELELVGRSTQLGDEGYEDNEDGSMVMLARHQTRANESTVDLNLADVNWDKYSEIIVKCAVESDGTLSFNMRYNNLSTGIYFEDGESNVAGTENNIDVNSATEFTLVDIGTDVISADVHFIRQNKDEKVLGWCIGMRGSAGQELRNLAMSGTNGTKVTSLNFLTSANNIVPLSEITIYGVKR